MGLKEKWKKFKEDFAFQKEYSKSLLKSRWDVGAEAGKELKKKHKEKIEKVVKKDGKS